MLATSQSTWGESLSVIVQNMDGAGGGVGTNYLGEIAPRDGTMVGYLSGAAWRYVNVREQSSAWTSSPTAPSPISLGTTVYYFRSDTVTSPIMQPSDFLEGEQHRYRRAVG